MGMPLVLQVFGYKEIEFWTNYDFNLMVDER